ncbi:MAG: hypothetical protein NT030_06725 [Candidatus Saganbacteria bacterium]|nr:hypothetical protein [Candidatus Saganbacteria bacterium]
MSALNGAVKATLLTIDYLLGGHGHVDHDDPLQQLIDAEEQRELADPAEQTQQFETIY